jgi:hypothetical protein
MQWAQPPVPGKRDGHRKCCCHVARGEREDVWIFGQRGEAADSRARARAFADAFERLGQDGCDCGRGAEKETVPARCASRSEKDEPHQYPTGRVSESRESPHQKGDAGNVPAAHSEQERFVESEELSHHELILIEMHPADFKWQMSFSREKYRQIHNLGAQHTR